MRPVFHCLILLSMSCGCTTALFEHRLMNVKQFALEQRVVNQFVDALSEDNEAALRNSVSSRFEQKALRSATAFKDLEILNLPKTKLVVAESEVVDDQTRHVVVAEEEDEDKKYQFHLVRDAEKRRWVVDDVLFRQLKKGARSTKSSTEVMDLLLTLREFLDTWQNGDRDAMLQVVSADLRSSLEELPEPWLKQLIGRVTAEYESATARRPEAQLNQSDAVVQLPARNGFLLVKIAREGDGWLVSDVEVQNRKLEDHPGSIRRQSEAMNVVTQFLAGYQQQNHELLESAASESFYQGSLQFADLTMIPLPAADFAPDDFELRAFAGQLTVMLPEQTRMVRMDVINREHQTARAEGETAMPPVANPFDFVVREVTIYDRRTMQQTNLSSAFSAPARGMLFLSALQERDAAMLRQISSTEFCRTTWDRLPPEMLPLLPLEGIPCGDVTLVNSRVKGQKTELEFQAASGQLLSLTLSQEQDHLKVDDMQYPNAAAEIVSLKTQVELTVPLLQLARAWRAADLQAVQQACSTEFNRLVWSNLSQLPADFAQLPGLLTAPIHKSQVAAQRATVVLQSRPDTRTTVQLLSEKGFWVVDEVAFQTADGSSVQMRAALRRDIAQSFLQNPSGTIQQANHSAAAGDAGSGSSGVVRAHAVMPARGNLTLPSRRKPLAPGNGASAVPDSSGMQQSSDNNGLLQFGPRHNAPAPVESGTGMPAVSDSAGVAARPDAATGVPPVNVEEHDGVVYFKPGPVPAAPAATADPAVHAESETGDPAELTEPVPVAPQSLKPVPPAGRITDPSRHPIAIPLN